MKNVMIADDEEGIRVLVCATLSGDDRYRLLTASTGLEALETARREKPDLAFLDIRMPSLDGIQVCRALKSDPATAHMKIVMLTALSQQADRERALAAGADEYLTKPFSPTRLLQKVEEVMGDTQSGKGGVAPSHPTASGR